MDERNQDHSPSQPQLNFFSLNSPLQEEDHPQQVDTLSSQSPDYQQQLSTTLSLYTLPPPTHSSDHLPPTTTNGGVHQQEVGQPHIIDDNVRVEDYTSSTQPPSHQDQEQLFNDTFWPVAFHSSLPESSMMQDTNTASPSVSGNISYLESMYCSKCDVFVVPPPPGEEFPLIIRKANMPKIATTRSFPGSSFSPESIEKAFLLHKENAHHN